MSALDGKVAFVTGGAGSIGLAAARALSDAGASVMITDLEQAALDSALEQLPAGRSAAAVADVTSSEQVAAAVAATLERFGRLDVVFANAGIFGVAAPVAEYPEDVFERVLAVNVLGPFHVAKHTVRHLPRGGSLIITSSVMGLIADANVCAYATSKHALVGLMRTLTKELSASGVRVNTIHPGPVDNDFQHAVEVNVTGAPAPQASAVFDGFIPLGRHASAAEIGAVVAFLAGDGAGFVTGATIAVDGGISS
ncbi:MAG TPA: SDR family NAD(P)-dependent oxidoreductase [Solirubrobacteraceae bacterium]|nr:SDR family NAD(P)-dependent oxidoreductase [Solirubrobacteraceae bacterium]